MSRKKRNEEAEVMPVRDVVFMGTPDFAVPSLEALLAAGYNVKAVFTQPDKPRGRSGKPVFSPVKACALAHDIPVYQPARIRDGENLALLKRLAPDVIVVAAFGQIIPKEILQLPPFGCLNVHASLLPKYRGAAPIRWAIINGERESGVTIMQMGEGLDTGDMLLKSVRELEPGETGGSLFDKLKEDGAGLLIQALAGLEAGSITAQPQSEISPTAYACMLTKQMGLVDWSRSAVSIERLIRGLDPWPAAYTYLRGRQLKLWRGEVADAVLLPAGAQNAAAAPGSIVRVEPKGFLVQTGDGVLRILELQLEGKKRMDAGAFLRGFALAEGETLSAQKDAKEN